MSVVRANLATVQMARILIVDPNQQWSAETEKLLSSVGYDASSAASFEEASRAIAASRPDLLVTVVRLGRFNGLHLALRARADHPDLPIVVVGETSDAGVAADAVKFGAQFASKTMDARDFLNLVATLLDGQERPKK